MRAHHVQRVSIGALVASAICILTGCGAADPDSEGLGDLEQAAAEEPKSVPVYIVARHRVDEQAARRLVEVLDLSNDSLLAPGAAIDEDGAFRYLDLDRFQRVPGAPLHARQEASHDESGKPTSPPRESVDFDALARIVVPSDEDALALAEGALRVAGLDVDGTPRISHDTLLAHLDDGRRYEAELDTKVAFELELEGRRLVGPGAKVSMTIDPEGIVTQAIYSARELVAGEHVPIVPLSRGKELCAAQLGGTEGEDLEVTAELVYFAPPLSKRVSRVLPHYQCSGRRLLGGRWLDVRTTFVPAIEDVPTVSLEVTVDGADVSAVAHVAGGAGPYALSWASSSGPMAMDRGGPDAIRYRPKARRAYGARDTLTLVVEDANGLKAVVSETVDFTPAKPKDEDLGPLGVTTAGTPYGSIGAEWIGSCGDLGQAAANANGFVSRFASSNVVSEFAWGDLNAWEIDFKDNASSGDDASIADSVDMVFYTGHADGTGFFFCSAEDDDWLHHTEAKWGNNTQNEWMIIAACGPLQPDGDAWHARWSPAFRGMHLLMGYQTSSLDNSSEGTKVANYMLRSSNPLPIRAAWSQAAIDVQPAGVRYAIMGVYGASWTMPNYNDHYWGIGPTGPDVSAASQVGRWMIWGDSG